MEDKDVLQFRVSPKWRKLKIISEPYVILNNFGYQPAVDILVEDKSIKQFLYISPKSLAKPLDELKIKNDNKFTGIQIKIKKTSAEKTATYEIEKI